MPLGTTLLNDCVVFNLPNTAYRAEHDYELSTTIGAAPDIVNTIGRYEHNGGTALNPPGTGHMGDLCQLVYETLDETQRIAHLHELQDFLFEDRRVVPLCNTATAFGVSDKVEGFEFDYFGAPFLQTIKVRK